jgi:hypothetical protein
MNEFTGKIQGVDKMLSQPKYKNDMKVCYKDKYHDMYEGVIHGVTRFYKEIDESTNEFKKKGEFQYEDSINLIKERYVFDGHTLIIFYPDKNVCLKFEGYDYNMTDTENHEHLVQECLLKPI